MSSALLKQVIKPLEKYFKIKGLVELCINKPGEIWIETYEGWDVKKDPDLTLKNLNSLAGILATTKGQVFDTTIPLLATALPGYGYRVQVAGGGMVSSGFSMSIRISAASRFPVEDYFQDAEERDRVKDLITKGGNLLIAGGTSSGKTTLMNSLLQYIPQETRIVVIEDTEELVVDQPNNVRIVKSKSGTDIAKITYKDIINSCMRLRPDRLIMGELDIDNTLPFLRLLNTGHAGCMATVHADGAQEAIDAITMNAKLAGLTGPVEDYARKGISAVIFIRRIDRRTFRATLENI
jgi:type IV secretion system protein VirB11